MKFSCSDIENIIKTDSYTFNIDEDTLCALNNILTKLNIKETISNKKISTQWRDKKHTRTLVKSTNLSDTDTTLHNIRRMINKITEESYSSLCQKIIKEFDTYEESDIKKIGRPFLDIMSCSSIYSKLYSKLYYEFRNKHPCASIILDEFVSDFDKTLYIFEYIDPSESYDGYCECVKKNDKKKLIIGLLCHMTNNGLLNSEYIVSVVTRLQTMILSGDSDTLIEKYEEITEILYVIFTISHDIISFTSNWDTIYKNIEYVTRLSSGNNISNKIIFRHMDIIDSLNE